MHTFLFEYMSKVFENTNKRIVIYSDSSNLKMVCNRMD